MKNHPKNYHEEVTEIFLAYYRELTGKPDKPNYKDGCLLHWISEYSPTSQTELFHFCYEAGYKAGLKKSKTRQKGRTA